MKRGEKEKNRNKITIFPMKQNLKVHIMFQTQLQKPYYIIKNSYNLFFYVSDHPTMVC